MGVCRENIAGKQYL